MFYQLLRADWWYGFMMILFDYTLSIVKCFQKSSAIFDFGKEKSFHSLLHSYLRVVAFTVGESIALLLV
jgi:hypothetical protein